MTKTKGSPGTKKKPKDGRSRGTRMMRSVSHPVQRIGGQEEKNKMGRAALEFDEEWRGIYCMCRNLFSISFHSAFYLTMRPERLPRNVLGGLKEKRLGRRAMKKQNKARERKEKAKGKRGNVSESFGSFLQRSIKKIPFPFTFVFASLFSLFIPFPHSSLLTSHLQSLELQTSTGNALSSFCSKLEFNEFLWEIFSLSPFTSPSFLMKGKRRRNCSLLSVEF